MTDCASLQLSLRILHLFLFVVYFFCSLPFFRGSEYPPLGESKGLVSLYDASFSSC